jgi:hypothetical protein
MRVVSTVILPALLLLMLTGSVHAGLDKVEQTKVDALAETLQLSAQQKYLVEKEREKSKLELLRLEEEWQRLHDKLRQEVRSDNPDQTVIDGIAGSIGRIRGAIISLRTRSLLYLKSILTPEQTILLEKAPADKGAAE